MIHNTVTSSDSLRRQFLLQALAAIVIVLLFTIFTFASKNSAYAQEDEPEADLGARGYVFTVVGEKGNKQIYLSTVGNPDAIPLSNNEFNDSQPTWSPDGTKIAFISDRNGNNQICVMNADGSDQRCLTDRSTPDGKPDASLPEDSQPYWSPDGAYIAFVSTQDGHKQIYIMNSEGGGIINLSNNLANEDQPVWSPDGKTIAFISDRAGNPNICIMDASGYNQRCLTANRTLMRTPNPNRTSDFMPTWSADSSKVAFVSTRDRNLEIYVMNRDGSYQLNLSKSLGDDSMPAWSPDGQFIIFTSNRDGGSNLYIMNSDGSNQRPLTVELQGDDFDPAWQPLPPDPNATPTKTHTPTPRVRPAFTKVIRSPVPATATFTPVPATPTTIWYPPTVPPRTSTPEMKPTFDWEACMAEYQDPNVCECLSGGGSPQECTEGS